MSAPPDFERVEVTSADELRCWLGEHHAGAAIAAGVEARDQFSVRELVFDNGRVVEEGTKDELLAAGGLFAGLWDLQQSGLLP